MGKYTIVEEHTTYLEFKVEAASLDEAKDKVDNLMWGDADEETTEYKNTVGFEEDGECVEY